MKKRILIFSIAYHPLVGGAELAVQHITDRLGKISPKKNERDNGVGDILNTNKETINTDVDHEGGYEFDLITCRLDRRFLPQERVNNVNVYRVGYGTRLGRFMYPVYAYRRAVKLHQAKPYDAVWSIMAAYAGAAALLFLRRFPDVRFLLTLQEGDDLARIQRQVRAFHSSWQKIFQRADYIQAISTYLSRWAAEQGAKGPIAIVPNGVDLNKFTMRTTANKNNDEDAKFIIVSTSRLVLKNGLDILIEAMPKVLSEIPQSKLAIAGVGPEEKRLRALRKKLGLEQKVEFLGNVSPELIPQILSRADVFVRASRSEGLGSSFLEAMATGLPVIGTSVGGIVDFLTDRDTGLFARPEDPIDLADKIILLKHDPILHARLIKNARELVEQKYTWKIVAEQMDEIFKRL